jgi:hypothetical protein
MPKKPARARERVVFTLNEPTRPIPGGARRQSVRVSEADRSVIRQRERVNRLLLRHDLERPVATIRVADLPLIRQIAREGSLSNHEPVLRRHAILLLGDHPGAENVNLLVDLARYGEDFYARSSALAALGKTGLMMAGPLLREGLHSTEPLERVSAEKGLLTLGEKIGAGALRAIFEGESDENTLRILARIAGGLAPASPKAGKPAPKRRKTSRRPARP